MKAALWYVITTLLNACAEARAVKKLGSVNYVAMYSCKCFYFIEREMLTGIADQNVK